MAQGNLQDAIEYSKKNPQSDFARQLKTRIESGAADQEAYDLGVDLSWAGRPAYEPPVVEEPGFLEQLTTKTGESINRRTENVMAGQQAQARGEQTGLETAAQTFGQGLGLAWDIGMNVVTSATPKPVKDSLKEGLKKIAETPSGQAGIEAITDSVEKYQTWKNENPENARIGRDLEALFNIAMSVPVGMGTKVGIKVGEDLIEAAPKIASGVSEKVTSLAETGTGTAERMSAKVREIVNPTKSEADLQKIIQTRFEKGVKPLLPGKTTPTQARKYKDDIVTAVETIRDNKANLRYADDGVDDIVEPITGRTPETLQQLSEALEQTKKTIFSKYDGLAKKAGEAGVKVDMNPIALELDTVIRNKALQLTNPKAVQYAKQVKDRYSKIGKLDATTAQDVIQNYNKSLEAFYRNPSYDNASNAAIDAMIANRIRKALDEGIEGMTGEQYQTLKSQYGALKSIERDVIKAALRDARKNVKGLIDYTDIFSGGQVVTGLLTLNPALIGSGAAQYGFKEFIKYLNSPNRAIRKMFEAAEELPAARSNLTPTIPTKPSPKGKGGGPNTQLEDATAELSKLPPKEPISNPQGLISLGSNVGITRKSLKHIIEQRGEDIISYIPKTLAAPTKIVDNSSKRPNSFLYARMNGNAKAVVLEVTKTPDGVHQVVSAFPVDSKTYKKMVDISGRPDVPPLHVSAVESEISTAQKVTSDSIPQDSILDKMRQWFKDNPPSIGLATKSVVEKGGFEGFDDLSTKLLEQLKGRKTVSKQFIEDATNQAALKQPERDLIRTMLKDEPDTIDVTAFANKVKSELLPLEIKKSGPGKEAFFDAKYESVNLPDELRGPVASYSEHIYSSPIKTSAGNVHFSNIGRAGTEDNYFAHSRIEDLADQTALSRSERAERTKRMMAGENVGQPPLGNNQGGTRRVIEIQSDLFQKGRLEGEAFNDSAASLLPPAERQRLSFAEKRIMDIEDSRNIRGTAPYADELVELKSERDTLMKKAVALREQAVSTRSSETAKLEPYRNTWHERVIREEVKQAAIDGKTKLQFPTGETAMKIEGLGDRNTWFSRPHNNTATQIAERKLSPDNLKVGQDVYQNGNEGDAWIITDVLGDGKFKAVPKENRLLNFLTNKETLADYLDVNAYEKRLVQKNPDKQDWVKSMVQARRKEIEQVEETFDISGKVDKENPIFKFYEKEVARYLKNKYGAKEVTDAQGITWWEVSIKKEMAKQPIEAYAATPFIQQQEEN